MSEKSKDLGVAKQVLQEIGLSDLEIQGYLSILGRPPTSAGELAIHLKSKPEIAQKIAEKLVDMGLFKLIPGLTPRYQVIPPYTALLHQLDDFKSVITSMKEKVPRNLADQFEEFVSSIGEVTGLEDFLRYMKMIKEEVPQALINQFIRFEDEFKKFTALAEFKNFINKIKAETPQQLAQRFSTIEKEVQSIAGLAEFKNFAKSLKETVPVRLVDQFRQIEDQTRKVSGLDDLKQFIQNSKTDIPRTLLERFNTIEDQFRKISGIKDLRDFVKNVKETVPPRLFTQFKNIESEVKKLSGIDELTQYVTGLADSVPQKLLKEYAQLESKFRQASQLGQFRSYITTLKSNVPQELATQFRKFQDAIEKVREKIFVTSKDQFQEWLKIMDDVFGQFINAFIQEIAIGELDKLKVIFEQEVITGVTNILSKVEQQVMEASKGVETEFANFGNWLGANVVPGFKNALADVETGAVQVTSAIQQGVERLGSWFTQEVIQHLEVTLSDIEKGADQLSTSIEEGLSHLKQWFSSDVIEGFTTALSEVDQGASYAFEAVEKGFDNLKTWFKKDVVTDISSTLATIEKSADSASNIITTEFTKLRNWFNTDLIRSISEILSTVELKIGDASKAVTKEFFDLRQQLERDVVKTTKETLAKVEEKVGSATTLITDSINRIRSTYAERVVTATRDMLTNVEDRVTRSQDTMYSLWEYAKSVVSYRFKDVWFVIGKEGTMAQINETVTKAKARLLIIAPELEDIDPIPILELKKHVAIRVAANIDPKSPKCQEVITQLAQRPNIELRNYPDKNVWGISRESEETLLSAVSGVGDVAGIATVVSEHQKMFVPILEDCWLKGRKYIMPETAMVSPTPIVAAPAVIAKISESRPLMEKEKLTVLFMPLVKVIKIGNPLKIVETLNTIKIEISQKFAWNVVLYEIDASIRRLKTKSIPLNQNEISEFLNKITDWQDRLSKATR